MNNIAEYLALLPVALLGLVAAVVGLYLAARTRAEKRPSEEDSTKGTTTGAVRHR